MLARQKVRTVDLSSQRTFDDRDVLALTPPRRESSSHRNNIVELFGHEGQRRGGIERTGIVRNGRSEDDRSQRVFADEASDRRGDEKGLIGHARILTSGTDDPLTRV